MDIRNRRAIHQKAREQLAAASGNPGRIALLYAAVCALMALLSSAVDLALSNRIAGTGGLGNIGLRSILSTVQTVLPLIQLVVTLCLSLGYHTAVLRIARGEDAQPTTLLEGFRRFGPLLRATFFQMILYFSLAVVSMYLSSYIFMLTPFSAEFTELLGPMLESPDLLTQGLVLDDATLYAAAETLVPMMVIWLGLFLLLFVPAFYKYRMTTFCIAEDPRMGALAAMHKSKLLLHRNRFALLKLDLSMWWFYALQTLISLVCYGEMILPMVGITLPWDPLFSYFFFFIVSMVIQTIAYYFLMNRVNVAYAVAYDALQQPEEDDIPEDDHLPFPTEY